MTPAGKLQTAQSLYEGGFLCKCTDWHEVTDFEGQEDMVLHHGEGCIAREKFLELMNNIDEEAKS
jgi:hypothetical protein